MARNVRAHPALAARVGLVAALALSAFAYWRILGGYFFADDFLYLYRAKNVPFLDLLLTPQFGHIQLIRNASYLLGADPTWYFVIELLTHLLNVALLFVLLRRLIGDSAVATFGAALWGTLPCQTGTLEWFAVYGHAVVATCLLAILCTAAPFGERAPSRRMVASWYALALIAATNFGVGVAVAFVLPLALACIAPGTWRRGQRLPTLWSLMVVVPAIYGLAQLYAISRPVLETDMLTKTVRLLNEPGAGTSLGLVGRIIAAAFDPAAPAMFGRLLAKGIETTVVGPLLPYSTNVVLSTAAAAVLFLAGVALACMHDRRAVRLVTGFVLLSAAALAIVAMGRARFLAVLDLSRLPVPATFLELQPRYLYLATMPLVVIWCIGLAAVARRFPFSPVLTRVAVAAWLALAGVRLSVHPLLINGHDEIRAEIAAGLQGLRARIMARPEGSTVVLPAHFFDFHALFVPASALPGWLALFTIYFPDDSLAGRRVVFAVTDPKVLEVARHGRRTGSLVRPATVGNLHP